MAIRQAYFDLNGTLFDPSAMAEPLGGDDAGGLVEEILGEAVLWGMAETLSGSYHDFTDLVSAAAARRLTQAGRADRIEAVTSAAQEMRPFPDAKEAVSTLSSAGLGVGVLTNSSTESAEALVAQSALNLHPIVGTDQVRAFKPDRRVYERGAAAAGRDLAEAALITAHGWDAVGAKRAGMVTAWVSRKEQAPPRIGPPPDLEVRTLTEAADGIVAAR